MAVQKKLAVQKRPATSATSGSAQVVLKRPAVFRCAGTPSHRVSRDRGTRQTTGHRKSGSKATLVRRVRPAASRSALATSNVESGADHFTRLQPREIQELVSASTPYAASIRSCVLRKPSMCVVSWNVNGIAALLKAQPEALNELAEKEKPDVILLQETKLQAEAAADIQDRYVPSGWDSKWVCSTQKLGYAGVAALWRKGSAMRVIEGVGLPEADHEGRCITVEFPRHFVVGCYVPNSGDGLQRLDFRINQWEPAVARHLRSLQARKPTLYCGDLNVAHQELDLWGNHNANSSGAGYTPQERRALTALLDGNKLVDSFRFKHPNVRAFTYWSYRFDARAKNAGWRLDYCLASMYQREAGEIAGATRDLACEERSRSSCH
eukprot:TRINITY_DN7745_c0_g1_i1.p1 TRINITY_DN7745_c0_g1~~TRINITY_DN7745_c0_g1_i1.p1  ORF type:complete len:380 (+),score=19.51 TRINITY_DN7745_c0_g1_i1:162-1301(+)